MQLLRRSAVCGVALALSTCAFGSTIVDNFNAGIAQAPNTHWTVITDIGWYYTPSVSYNLEGIQTTFVQSTGAGDVNRTVTIGVYTDRPANGGSLLGSNTFDTATARSGTYGGPSFPDIALIGGHTYFIGLSNILNLGVNEVDFNQNGGAGPNGSTVIGPGGTWADSNGLAQFGTQASNGTTWFDKPVIRFLGPNPTSAVPEPGTVILMLGGLAAFFARRRHRSI